MPKHDCGVALYPPPEVGGFTATEDNQVDDIYDSGPHVENSVEDSDEHKNEDEDG